jgi:hypothetical protein
MIAWATEPSSIPPMPPRPRLPTTISCASAVVSSSAVRGWPKVTLPQDGQLRVLLFEVGDVVVDGLLHPASPAQTAGGIGGDYLQVHGPYGGAACHPMLSEQVQCR